MAMSLTIKNKDGSDAGFSLVTYLITKYFDKYGTAEITCTPHETIQENSTIEASYKGNVRFRGYIDIPEINEDKTARIVAYELQRLLEYRFTQYYTYPAGTTITNMLSHAEPVYTGTIGLLYMANSLIPQGAFIPFGAGPIYYIKDYLGRGGGTLSKFGTVTKMYANTTALTHITNLNNNWATMTPGTFYQDGNDLWVRMPDDRDPQYWLVSIPNWKDTKLHLSSSVSLTSVLPTPYRLGKTQVATEVDRLVKSFGKEWQWYHDTNGYSYLIVASTVGRGTPISGVVNYRENDTIYTYAEDQTGDPRIDGLIGAGAGQGITQNVYSLLNLYGEGTWKEDIYEDSHQFADQLKNSMAVILPDKLEPLSITITADEDPAVNVGDYANILKANSNPITKRIKQIEYSNDGEMRIMLGQRLLDFSDVTKRTYDLLGSYNDFVNSNANSWSFSFNNDTISNSVPFHQTFKIATDEIDTDYPYRFRMDVSIGWYKDPAGSVTSAVHAHTGSTGSGGGSSHGASSSGGNSQHSTSSDGTTGPNSTANVAGSHTHGISGSISNGSASVVTSVGSAYGYAGSCGNCSFITAVGGPSHSSSNISSGATLNSLSCGMESNDSIIPGPSHGHTTNAGYTTSGGTHGDHYVSDNPQHNLPMNNQNLTPTVQTSFPTLYDTGNSTHVLTLTVKINGSNVPGSPFQDYYVGETISDIDITSLVATATDNAIDISITEYAGASPVRCSLYGSVHSLYVLTSI